MAAPTETRPGPARQLEADIAAGTVRGAGGLVLPWSLTLHTLNPHDGPAPAQLFDRFLGWALIPRTMDDSTRHPVPGTSAGRSASGRELFRRVTD